MTTEKELIEALEPCPFCRGEFPPVLTVEGSINRPTVICAGCSALGPSGATPAEAIAAWNTRARSADEQPTPPDNLVEVVAQFLHDEGGFDEAWLATWPEHPDDTGQRDGGFVRIVPSDVQAKFRDVARRLVGMLSPHLSEREKVVAWRDVIAERRRQVQDEGWTPEHDDEHDAGELAGAGAAYALNAGCLLYPHHGTPLDEPPEFWMWDKAWWKPQTDPDLARRDLVKAAALIVAEIERIDRALSRGDHISGEGR